MRIAVFSDTHRDREAMRAALPLLRALGPEAIFHLGDCVPDVDFLGRHFDVPIERVRGNCDWGQTAPAVRVAELGGARFFLTHGHDYGVKNTLAALINAARGKECVAALFGHTHSPFCERREGLLLLNPGSLAQPRGVPRGSFALLMVENGAVEATVVTV